MLSSLLVSHSHLYNQPVNKEYNQFEMLSFGESIFVYDGDAGEEPIFIQL